MNLDQAGSSEVSLADDLFCTRFELETLAGIVHKGSLERWVPGFTSEYTHEQHVKRYDWACQFVRDKRVLDMACGVGRGSYVLAEKGGAASVLGVDLDASAVRYASVRNAHARASYQVGDAQAFQTSAPFDVVIGFETIEHLPNVEAYLQTVQRVLGPGGQFFVSTPISRQAVDHHPDNPFHVIEWGMEAFAQLLGKFFVVEKTFVQLKKPPRTPLQRALRPILKPKTEGYVPLVPVDLDLVRVPGAMYSGYQILQCRQIG